MGSTGIIIDSWNETIKLIINRNNLVNSIYVGDSKAARIPVISFIYAKYGFSTVNDYDYAIDRFKDKEDFFSLFF